MQTVGRDRRFEGAVMEIKIQRRDTKPKEVVALSNYRILAVSFTLDEKQQQRQGSNAMFTARH